jgi:hypothetical protein
MKNYGAVFILVVPCVTWCMEQKQEQKQGPEKGIGHLLQLSQEVGELFRENKPDDTQQEGDQSMQQAREEYLQKLKEHHGLSTALFLQKLENEKLVKEKDGLQEKNEELAEEVQKQEHEARVLRNENRELREALEKLHKEKDCCCIL